MRLPDSERDVGYVAEVTSGIDGCYISCTKEPQELASLIKQALTFQVKSPAAPASFPAALKIGWWQISWWGGMN